MHFRIVILILLFKTTQGQDKNSRFKKNGEIDFQEVDNFLRRYGYLRDEMEGSTRQASKKDRREALKRFQHYLEPLAHANDPITITGECDDPTLIWMSKPRCGCEDMPIKKMMRVKRQVLQHFKPLELKQGPKWPSNDVTWRLTKVQSKLDENLVRREIIRAFQTWSDVSGLRFREQSGKVNILLSFEDKKHGDGFDFDGNSGVLAHAFYPEDGKTHFDNDETWTINKTNGIDIYTVAAHEIGHALGLEHTQVFDALMAPFYQGFDANFKLHADDIMRIQAVYGNGRATTQKPPVIGDGDTIPIIPPPKKPTSAPRRTTTVPTRRPQSPDEESPDNTPRNRDLPDICYTVFEAITRDDNGDILAVVNGDSIMRIDERIGKIGELKKIQDLYPDGPTGIDDFTNIQSDGTLFFRRFTVWRFMLGHGDNTRQLTEVDYIPYAKLYIPEPIRATIPLNSNMLYIIGDSMYYIFDINKMEIVPNSHKRFDKVFPELPSQLDSALQMDVRTVFFFKGPMYYRYDKQQKTLTGPMDVGPAFIKGPCGNQPK